MDTDTLYDAVMAAKTTGQANRLWIERAHCKRNCWIAAAYDIHGTTIVVAPSLRLSPGRATELGVPQHTGKRAWTRHDWPTGDILLGCRHTPPFPARITNQPRVQPLTHPGMAS